MPLVEGNEECSSPEGAPGWTRTELGVFLARSDKDFYGSVRLPGMGEQSASRLAGDEYQHSYSWFELLQLLPPESHSHGFVEHPHAGWADDVTFLAN